MERRTFVKTGIALAVGFSFPNLPMHSQAVFTSDWLVTPYEGVGPLKFGMKRRKARRAVPGRPDQRDEFDNDTDDVWHDLGIKLTYLPPKYACSAIHCAGSKVPLVYRDKPLMNLPARELYDLMLLTDPDLSTNGRGWTSMRDGITITAPHWQSDGRKPIDAALFFAEGFYTSFFE